MPETPNPYAPQVAAGATLLDQLESDWVSRINLETLELCSSCNCVLGQLYGSYFDAAQEYVSDHPWEDEGQQAAQSLGFIVDEDCLRDERVRRYALLTRAWVELIQQRRTARVR